MEIRPIRNDDDHAAAVREIEQLWGSAVGTDDGDRLDILATLVEKYEGSRWPLRDGSDPIDSQAELAELLGSRSRASEVLSRRRSLTVEMIRKISQAWRIPADLLVRPSRVPA